METPTPDPGTGAPSAAPDDWLAGPATVRPGTSSKSFSIIAIVIGLLATLFFPIVLGPIGIVLAAVATIRRERWWKAAVIVAVAGTLVGFALGYYAATHLVH
ncbi:MAG: hypothetical protein ACRDGQ_13020 [Candidatus Limnocylindrales bacterium]